MIHGSTPSVSGLAWPLRLLRRFLPVLMLLSLLMGLLGALRLGLSLDEPFPGLVLLWRKEYKLYTVSWVTPPNWRGPEAGMMINDRILCIADTQPYVISPTSPVYGLDPRYAADPCEKGSKNYADIFRDTFQSADPRVDIRVDRDGQILTIPNVPLVRVNLGLLLETFLPSFLLGLALLGLGLVVLRANPEFEINLVFSLLMLCAADLTFFNALAGLITDRQFETSPIWTLLVPWFTFMGPLVFHLIDLLASPGPLSAVSLRLRRPYYLLAGALSVVGVLVLVFPTTPLLRLLTWVYIVGVALSCVFALIWALVSLGLAYRRAVRRQVRRQTGLVLAALGLGALICLPFAGLFFASALVFPYMQGLPYVALLVLALIAYAILRYQLFDARAQTLTFLLVLVISVIAAFIIYIPVGRQISFLPLLGSSLLSGSVFTGQLKPLGFLDRLLHREELDYQVVTRFSQQIRQPQNVEQLAKATLRALKAELETDQADLWLLAPNQPTLEYYTEETPVEIIPLDPALPARVVQPGGPVFSHSSAGQHFTRSLPHGAQLRANGLWVPLSDRDQALGVLYLGPRWTGEIYNEDDLGLVRLLTTQLGLALTNTRQMERVQTMQRQILQAEENERYKIARELHDTILQFLSVLTFGLDSLKKNPDALNERVASWQGRIRSEAGSLRNLLSYLRTPETLEQRGLLVSLEALLGVMRSQTTTGLEFELDPLVEGALPAEAKVALYRVVREAVQNALKHAGAQHVGLRLVRAGERVVFSIEDDGQGFDLHAAFHATTKGYNSLQDMRIYIESTGGQLQIQSAPGQGTQIGGWVPALPPSLG